MQVDTGALNQQEADKKAAEEAEQQRNLCALHLIHNFALQYPHDAYFIY
jgi:hypothetical protein